MLLKESISNIPIHSEQWFLGRLGKFTSSEFHYLMGERGLGSAGENYVFRKCGEELTGQPNRKEVSTEATEHGNLYELDNLRAFASEMGIEFLITQKLITPPDSRFGSTPDGLIVKGESADGLGYDVFTVEAKCPFSYDGYIRLWKCRTPEDVKKENRAYYFQVLHQMFVCDSLRGYLSIFQPNFKAGQLRIIEFKRADLIDEFKLVKQRSIEAVLLFEKTRNEMLGL